MPDRRLLFLHSFVLVEQHRVDLLVADSVGLSFFVHQYQGRIHLCDFFSNQAKLGHVSFVPLVMEGHWFKRKDGFTGRAHGVNVLLEPRRGDPRTKLAVRVNNYWSIGAANGRTIYTADKNLRGSTTYLRGTVVDADGLALIKRTAGGHSPADIDVVETVYYVKPGRPATQHCVMKAAYVELQYTVTDRYVTTAGIIIKQRINTHGFVENTSGVTTERGIADGAV